MRQLRALAHLYGIAVSSLLDDEDPSLTAPDLNAQVSALPAPARPGVLRFLSLCDLHRRVGVGTGGRADAVIYSTPVYHMGISSHLKAAIDKLGHVAFAQYDRRTPRFLKVIGAIAQGNSGFGGQELALLNLLQHAVVMNSLLVTADKPDSYMGVAGREQHAVDHGRLQDGSCADRGVV